MNNYTQKAIFLDRDGVINVEKGRYIAHLDDFEIIEGVTEALQTLKKAGYLLVIVTNQGGINKGEYTHQTVLDIFAYLQSQCNGVIDAHYYSPYSNATTRSLFSKPDSLMLEKAIAKYGIDVSQSWLVGDAERDIVAAQKVNVRTIHVKHALNEALTIADYHVGSLAEATAFILSQDYKPNANT
ncbi:MAG: HAD-IIIA family hydrolase [Cytophagales bacterium]|nr:MAG: HAD-IIIA family hydrolase [Cytophagales bacterium]